MLITYYGHSLFAMETMKGYTIITDPYDQSVGYPMGRLSGDVVTVSHEHHDHNNLGLIDGDPIIIRGEGTYKPLPGVRIIGYPSFHDGEQGERRGRNTLFLIEADGLRVLHLGDLGHLLPQKLNNDIGRVDVLMIPVGGFYTIDAQQAESICQSILPSIIIPMHYRTEKSANLPISPVEDFLRLLHAEPSPMPLLRVTRDDLSQQPKVARLAVKPLPVSFRG